ncbi:MAG: glycosyltransferase family 4 protein [Pseudomonadota bacterium]
MIRVRHIVRQFAPSVGGLETFVALLAQSLRAHDCESDILTLDRVFEASGPRLPLHERIEDLDVHRVPMIGHRRLFAPLISERRLRDYDVLHVHGIDGMFERIARHPKRQAQICIATSHGAFFHTPWMTRLKRAYFQIVTKRAARRYNCLIANSAPVEALLQQLGRPVVQVPNGVAPLGAFRASGRDLLCLGRLSSHKRVDRLIAMMAAPELANTRLHIVGPEWDVKFAELREQASVLGVSDRVLLHGHVSSKRLAEIASSCGAFVSASNYEGFGMSLIEAMSVGLIPLVNPNASFQQLLAKAGVGALITFDDPLRAAGIVAHALANAADDTRTRAIQFSEAYSWVGHARTTAGLYAELLTRQSAS